MHSKVLFRDRQDFQGNDWANVQSFMSASLRHLAGDGFAGGAYYKDLDCLRNSDTSVLIKSGRLWRDGRIYTRDYPAQGGLVDIANYLPIVNIRKLALVIWGREIQTHEQQRYFVTDITKRQVEALSVPMVLEREGVVDIVAGDTALSPVLPAIPAGALHFCTITLDPSGIVSVEMIAANRMPSNDGDLQWLEDFKRWRLRIQAQLEALLAEALSLEEMTQNLGGLAEVRQIGSDVAWMVEMERLPRSLRVAYDADRFVDLAKSDVSASGYDARLFYGLLFPPAAEATIGLELLSPADSAGRLHDGFLLPAYDSVLAFRVALPASSDTGFAAESVTVESRQIEINTWRNVNGWSYSQYTHWFDNVYPYGRTDYLNPRNPQNGGRSTSVQSYTYLWNKTWNDHWVMKPLYATIFSGAQATFSGAMIAQTIMAPSSMWLTRIGIHLTQVGPSGDVTVSLYETTQDGKPWLDGFHASAVISHDDLATSAESLAIFSRPVWLEGGSRYAVVLSTSGNHRLAASEAGSGGNIYSEGNLFTIASGGAVQAQLGKDLALSFYSAKFERTRTVINLKPASLSGGIRDLALEAQQMLPLGAELQLQYQLAGEWRSLEEPFEPDPLPALLPLRLVFLGTTDMQGGIVMPGSTLTVSRAKLSLTHHSTQRTLPTGSTEIMVQLLTHRFDSAQHTLTVSLMVAGSPVAAAATEMRVWEDGSTQHIFEFTLGSPITQYEIRTVATRANASVAPFAIVGRQDVAS